MILSPRKVIIIDKDAVTGQTYREIFNHFKQFELLGIYPSISELPETCQNPIPDIIMLENNLA